MDYSTLPNDPDHPADSSPWQSSPQPTSRQSFTSPRDQAPASPTPGQSPRQSPRQSPYNTYDQRRSQEDGSDQEVAASRSGGYGGAEENPRYAPAAAENGSSSNHSERYQGPPSTEQGYGGQQYQQQQRPVGPHRYHSAGRPNQRQNIPQYKLQAKITGLERTGRKDPILRFDVHVGMELSDLTILFLTMDTDKSSKIPHYSISRRTKDTF